MRLFVLIPLVTTLGFLVLACSGTPDLLPRTGEHDQVETGLAPLRQNDTVEADLPVPFVRLVDLARLRVGMTRGEVLTLLPNPEEIETTRRDTEFWGYEYAELLFRDGRLENWFYLPRGRVRSPLR